MGLENIGGWELIVIVLLGLFIFGPDKLPKAIGDGLRVVRQLRDMARNATSDLSRELGTDIQLEDLHPRTFVRKHLLSEEDEAVLRKPLEDAFADLKQTASGLDLRAVETAPVGTKSVSAKSVGTKSVGTGPASTGPVGSDGDRRTYDADAT